MDHESLSRVSVISPGFCPSEYANMADIHFSHSSRSFSRRLATRLATNLDYLVMPETSADHRTPSPVSDSDDSGQDEPWTSRPRRGKQAGLQVIHSRFIPDPGVMFVQLQKTFGAKNFAVTVLLFSIASASV